jgi:hypothetical protein
MESIHHYPIQSKQSIKITFNQLKQKQTNVQKNNTTSLESRRKQGECKKQKEIEGNR